MRKKQYYKSRYLHRVFDNEFFRKTVKDCLEKLEKFRTTNPFDTIAFTGVSGSALAYPLSHLMKIPLICVRKNYGGSHYGGPVEGSTVAKRYIIVDDFIDTGNTIRRIMAEISNFYGTAEQPKLVGILLYNRFNRIKIITPQAFEKEFHNVS